MAEIVYFEVNSSNKIVALRSEEPLSSVLPSGHSIVSAQDIVDPAGLLGQDVNLINDDPKDRVPINALTDQQERRLQLLKLSNELDLQARMGESTTDTQAAFDTLKTDYENNQPQP